MVPSTDELHCCRYRQKVEALYGCFNSLTAYTIKVSKNTESLNMNCFKRNTMCSQTSKQHTIYIETQKPEAGLNVDITSHLTQMFMRGVFNLFFSHPLNDLPQWVTEKWQCFICVLVLNVFSPNDQYSKRLITGNQPISRSIMSGKYLQVQNLPLERKIRLVLCDGTGNLWDRASHMDKTTHRKISLSATFSPRQGQINNHLDSLTCIHYRCQEFVCPNWSWSFNQISSIRDSCNTSPSSPSTPALLCGQQSSLQ